MGPDTETATTARRVPVPGTEAKSPDFIVRSADPLCGGAPDEALVDSYVTPRADFFVRNHAAIPRVETDTFRLRVDGLVERPLELTLADLRARFPRVEVVATLQCAGNRREELVVVAPVPGEVVWGTEAISNGRWAGVQLRALLAAVGVDDAAKHVGFRGLDQVERHGVIEGFGASISLERALRPDVLLAFEMNGAPLPPEHGGPLRVVVPGYIGARSVKWLTSIELRRDPSDAYFEAHAYKLFAPSVTAETADWAGTPPIEAMQLSSVICRPAEGSVVPAGPLVVEGWATAGGDRSVVAVELSTDGGATWMDAGLVDPGTPGIWRRWRCEVQASAGPVELAVRARDSTGLTQPVDVAERWNFKGYMNDAWHRVTVRVE